MYRILTRPTTFTHYPQRLVKPNKIHFVRPQERYLISRSSQQIHLLQKGHPFFLFALVASSIALLILSKHVQSEEKTLDQLEALAKTLGTSLPKREERESFVSWHERCEQFCFHRVLEACVEGRIFDLVDKQLLDQLTDKRGRSLLLAAAQEADIAVVQMLVDKKVSIRRTDLNGNTPLHLAVEIGRSNLIPILKNYIDIPNNSQESALHVAIRCGHAHLIAFLIQQGSNPTRSCYYENLKLDSLSLSVATGHADCLDVLVQHSDTFNHLIAKIGNLLHLALQSKNPFILRHLLTNYHDHVIGLIDRPDDPEGRTPLSLACAMGYVEEIEFLIAQKANPDIGDTEGKTPAHWAAKNRQIEALEILAYHGVDLEKKDLNDKRPEDYLKQFEEVAIDLNRLNQAIINYKSGCKEPPDFGRRPPHYLTFQGGGPKGIAYLGALEALEEQGALAELKGVAGTSAGAITAVLLATGHTSTEMRDILMHFDLRQLLDPRPENEHLTQAMLKAAKSKNQTPILNYFLKESVQNILSLKSPFEIYLRFSQIEGLCEGEYFREWIDTLITAKTGTKYCTFGEFKKRMHTDPRLKHLHVYATQIYPKSESTCFSTHDPKYENVIISDAIRASMSIPGVFKPHEIHYKDPHIPNPDQARYQPRYVYGATPKFVDGGVLKNCPFDAFDSIEYQTHTLAKNEWNKKIYNHRTLSLCLRVEQEEQNQQNIQGTKDIALALAMVYLNAQAIIAQSDPENKKRLIEIPIKGVSLLDFDVSQEKKEAMIQAGREAILNAPMLKKNQIILNPALRKNTNLFNDRLHPNFIGREAILKQVDTHFTTYSKTQIRVLFGLPGMGKTQIALNYADKNRHRFSSVWVIDCRTEAVRDRDYRTIATKLDLHPEFEKDIEAIRQRVHRHLEDRSADKPWLLVLDNVDKTLDPSKDWPQRGGYILITTAQKTIWNPQDYLPEVIGLSPSEALRLLTKVTKEKESEDMKKLAKALGYFPLALTLAGNYIGSERINTIAEYVKAYEKIPMKAEMNADTFYKHTLQNVWEMTLHQIEKKSTVAASWLNICAYLHPDRIPTSWLEEWLETQGISDQGASMKVKKILEEYAVIHASPTEGSMALHGLLQHAIRDKHTTADPYLHQIFSLFKKHLDQFDRYALETWPQAETVYIHTLRLQEEGFFKYLEPQEQYALLFQISNVCQVSGYVDQNLQFSQQCLKIQEQHSKIPHPAVATSLNNLGVALRDLGKYDQAVEYHKHSLEMQKQIYGDKLHPDVADSLNNLGRALQALGEYDQAIKYHERSLEMRKQIYGDRPHPTVAYSLNNLGRALRTLGKYDQAIEYYKHSLEMQKQIYGDKPHPEVAASLNNLGLTLHDLREYDQAVKYHKHSLEMQKQIYGDKPHPAVAVSLNNLGRALHNFGKCDQAIACYERSLEMNKQIYGDKPHPDVASSLNNLGNALNILGKYEQALAYYERSLEMRKQIYGDKPIQM